MLNNYICTVDIGSSKIASVVAKINKKRITNLFFESTPSKGLQRGAIVDSIGLVGSINRLLKSLKARSGINIKFIYANISGSQVITKHSRAIIPLTERGNKVIAYSDIRKVNEQARILAANLEEEIIHQIPIDYTIDSQSNILNPLGLYSHRLEVDLYLVCAKLSLIQSLARVINQTGYEIKNTFFSGLATSRAIFDRGFKAGIPPIIEGDSSGTDFSGGVDILCDIGSDITELLIFRNGLLQDIVILSLGGDDITAELSDGLKVPFDLAEDTKRSHGAIGDYSQIKEDKEILVKKSNIYKPIKQRLVSEIITAKTKLICQTIRDAVDKKLDLSEVSNFAVVGRTILLEGFIEMLEDTLGVPVKLGRVAGSDAESSASRRNPPGNYYIHDMACLVNKDNALSGQKFLSYITALGMVCEALLGSQAQILPNNTPPQNLIFKAINRIKEVYQEYF